MTAVDTRAVHAGRDDLAGLGVHVPPIDLSTTNPLPSVDDGGDAYETARHRRHPPRRRQRRLPAALEPHRGPLRDRPRRTRRHRRGRRLRQRHGRPHRRPARRHPRREAPRRRRPPALRRHRPRARHRPARHRGDLGPPRRGRRRRSAPTPRWSSSRPRPTPPSTWSTSPPSPPPPATSRCWSTTPSPPPCSSSPPGTAPRSCCTAPPRASAATATSSPASSPATTEWAARLRQVRAVTGAILHPLGAYLLHRGLQTLPLRVRAQQAGAREARRLARRPPRRRPGPPPVGARPGRAGRPADVRHRQPARLRGTRRRARRGGRRRRLPADHPRGVARRRGHPDPAPGLADPPAGGRARPSRAARCCGSPSGWRTRRTCAPTWRGRSPRSAERSRA